MTTATEKSPKEQLQDKTRGVLMAVPMNEIAKLTGLDVDTVRRFMDGGDQEVDHATLTKLVKACLLTLSKRTGQCQCPACLDFRTSVAGTMVLVNFAGKMMSAMPPAPAPAKQTLIRRGRMVGKQFIANLIKALRP